MVTRGQSRRHVAKRVDQFAKAAASIAGTAAIGAGNIAVKNLLKYFSQAATPQKQRPKISDVFNLTPKPKQSPGMTGERKKQPYKRRSYKSASSSRSKGFFKRGKKKRTFLDRTNSSVTFCREQGKAPALDTDVQTTYVGHATATPEMLFEEFVYSLVKWIAVKMQYEFTDFKSQIKPFGDNYVFELTVKNNMDATATNLPVFTAITGSSRWQDLADDFTAKIQNWLAVHPYGSLVALRMYSANTGRYDFRSFDLTRASIVHGCKSTLKIQNRTINSAGNDEVDDVDNVPLYGKSYEGNGNYLKYHANQATQEPYWISVGAGTTGPAGGNTIGLIDVNYAAASTGKAGHPLSEPPKPSQLQNVARSGKAHLDPGEIKTSVLYHRIKMNVNTFLRKMMIFNETTLFTIRKDIKLGNYRIFAFEKMLKVGAETSTTQMKLAYEVDQKSWCTFTAPKSPVVNTVLQLTNA